MKIHTEIGSNKGYWNAIFVLCCSLFTVKRSLMHGSGMDVNPLTNNNFNGKLKKENQLLFVESF